MHRFASSIPICCLCLLAFGFALVPVSRAQPAPPSSNPNPTNETSTLDPAPGDPPIVRADPPAIPLWADGAPGSEGHSEPERWMIRREPGLSFPVVSRINNPSITPFLPNKANATGAAVIVAPGGGHMFHSIDHEGYDVARWLQEIGVAAFVLKYRLARQPDGSPYTIQDHAAADGHRAVRLVRSRAAEWGIDPERIAFLGFSAGGEVGGIVASTFTPGDPASPDPVERVGSRPDLVAYAYPGMPRPFSVTADSPPAFFFAAWDDARPTGNILKMAEQYRAAGVPAEIHIFASGDHGFGIRKFPLSIAYWPDRLLDWMMDRKFITEQTP